MSSALLFYTFSLCFSLLSIERKNKEAPERYGPVPPKAEVVSSNLAGCAIFVPSSAEFRTLRHRTHIAC